jgi:hypothetical protein
MKRLEQNQQKKISVRTKYQVIYDPKNKYFKNMSEEDFYSLFDEYFNGTEDLRSLYSKYNNLLLGKWSGKYPNIQTHNDCPYCKGHKMIAKWTSTDVINHSWCGVCGHFEKAPYLPKCECKNCLLTKNYEETAKEEAN